MLVVWIVYHVLFVHFRAPAKLAVLVSSMDDCLDSSLGGRGQFLHFRLPPLVPASEHCERFSPSVPSALVTQVTWRVIPHDLCTLGVVRVHPLLLIARLAWLAPYRSSCPFGLGKVLRPHLLPCPHRCT